MYKWIYFIFYFIFFKCAACSFKFISVSLSLVWFSVVFLCGASIFYVWMRDFYAASSHHPETSPVWIVKGGHPHVTPASIFIHRLEAAPSFVAAVVTHWCASESFDELDKRYLVVNDLCQSSIEFLLLFCIEAPELLREHQKTRSAVPDWSGRKYCKGMEELDKESGSIVSSDDKVFFSSWASLLPPWLIPRVLWSTSELLFILLLMCMQTNIQGLLSGVTGCCLLALTVGLSSLKPLKQRNGSTCLDVAPLSWGGRIR